MSALDTGTNQLLCEIADGVATVTLNRPHKRNALSDELTPALRNILLVLETHPEVRCIVLTGAGNAFCAGGDVSQMGADKPLGGAATPFADKVANLRNRQRTLTLRLYELSKPTIAALPGPAAGAGMAIALACDLRVACESAFFATGYGAIGLSGDYGGSWLLTRLVGPAVAKELYFTGRRLPAREALTLGLLNTVWPDPEFGAGVAELAATIAAQAPLALRYMKTHINEAAAVELGRNLDSEAEHLLRCADTDDHRDAVRAFLDKRAPIFHGR